MQGCKDWNGRLHCDRWYTFTQANSSKRLWHDDLTDCKGPKIFWKFAQSPSFVNNKPFSRLLLQYSSLSQSQIVGKDGACILNMIPQSIYISIVAGAPLNDLLATVNKFHLLQRFGRFVHLVLVTKDVWMLRTKIIPALSPEKLLSNDQQCLLRYIMAYAT